MYWYDKVFLNAHGTLTVAGSIQNSPVAVNGGTVVVTGSAIVSPFTVNGGSLTVNGSAGSSSVVLGNGGVLRCSGIVGATTLQAGGMVAPGNSIGTLHVNGNYGRLGTVLWRLGARRWRRQRQRRLSSWGLWRPLGLRGTTHFTLNGTDYLLKGMVGWRYAVGDVHPVATESFQGGASFDISGAPTARNATISLSYNGQFSSKAADQGVLGALNIAF